MTGEDFDPFKDMDDDEPAELIAPNTVTSAPEVLFERAGCKTERHEPKIAPKYPSRFGLLTWSEIDFDLRTDMLIKGLIEQHSSALLYGDSGSGKTFLAGDIGIHVSLGRPWFGRKVLQGGVIYIAAEGGLSMRRRVVAFRQHYGIDRSTPIPFALIPSPVNLLDPQVDMPELLVLIKAVAADFPAPLRLIQVDTVSRALAGGNENGPEDMGAFVKNLDHLRSETGAATIAVHHTGKDPTKGGRGHSLLRAAVDTEIEVARTSIEGQSVATITKQRDGETGQAFTFNLQRVELGSDEDGSPLTSCVVMPIEHAVMKKPAKGGTRTLTAEYLKALDYLHDTLAEHGEFRTASGIPSGTRVVHLDRWRDCLKQRGLHDGTENGKKWFQRVRGALIAHEKIAVDDPYVWVIKS